MERLGSIATRTPIGQGAPQDDDAKAARRQFRDELAQTAAACRHELVDEAIRVYWNALKAVPVEIRTLGLTRCLQTRPFFPTVSEVLHACADVVDERRAVLAREAAAIREQCELRKQGACNGTHRETHGGVVRCDCHIRSVALLEQAGQPIARPALPPTTNEATT